MQALLIDLDGTLADSMSLCYDVFCAFHEKHGRQATREEFNRWVGPSIHEMIPALCADWGVPTDELLKEYLADLERAYNERLTLFPGAAVFLKLAQALGLQTALVTAANRESVDGILEREDLYFDVSTSGSDVDHAKPDPEIYLRTLDALNCAPENAVAIEDSPAGIRSAVGADIKCLQFAPIGQPSYPGSSERFLHWQQLTQALLQPVCDFLPVTGELEIELRDDAFSISPEIEQHVDELWVKECEKRPELFDGTVFCVQKPDSARLVGRILPYRYVLAQHLCPELRISIGAMPVGVTGITQADDRILVGKRGLTLTHYAGMRELAPSGVLDQQDWKKQLLTELQEECGYTEIVDMWMRGVIYDPIAHTLDIIATIRLPDTCVQETPETNDEYVAFAWMRREDILSSLEREPGQWVPTTNVLGEE